MSYNLETIELIHGGEPQASVIWLHGLGADGNDFVPIVRELTLPKDFGIRFIFPHAPIQPVTINGGMRMRAWYDIEYIDLGRKIDQNGVRSSQKGIEALIQKEKDRGIPANKILLAGFSQGGAVVLQTGLCFGEKLAGIVALSTYLPIPEATSTEASTINKDIPIFMAHGTEDSVVLPTLAKKSYQTLIDNGYQVEWQEYPMPHSVCLEEIEAISDFLQKIL